MTVEIRRNETQAKTSRLCVLFTDLSLTKLIIPPRMELNSGGVQTRRARFFLFPWMKEEEHAAYRRIASVRHDKGLIWDSVIIETAGGSNAIEIKGLRKRDARRIVMALREQMASEAEEHALLPRA